MYFLFVQPWPLRVRPCRSLTLPLKRLVELCDHPVFSCQTAEIVPGTFDNPTPPRTFESLPRVLLRDHLYTLPIAYFGEYL